MYCRVHFLKHKSEFFGLFKVFKALVENQSGRKLKALRSDNGGEYVKYEFINYCADAGIQMQHSIPYTPQRNGVAERKNRSLKEMATCMMEAKTLPPNFWTRDIYCAYYIQNMVPHNNIDGMTPFKAWSGHNPDVTHFKILAQRLGLEFQLKRGRICKPKAKSSYFLGILKIQKGTS